MARGSSSSATARRLGLLAVAAGLAWAVAAAGRRPGRREREPATYRCACGAAYRVSGMDRHRVYWREGAPDDAPVLGDRCEECDAALPSGHEAVAA